MFARAITSPPDNRGFTLVELLMALLVMTVGLLGLLQSVNVAYKHTLKDRLRKEAMLLAEEWMHDWCSRSFDSITSSTPPAPPILMQKQGEKLVSGAPWRFTVTREAKTVGSNSKKLQVAVTWTINGEPARHEIFTLRTKRGGE